MTKTCTALFTAPGAAAAAINALIIAGIPEKDVSILASDKVDRNAFAIETNSKAAEGAAAGAVALGGVGALVGALTAVGSIATSGAGLLVSGPIVAAFAAGGAGAAAGAGLGALVGLAIPEHEVKHFEEALEAGSVLIGVQFEDGDRHARIERICETAGATRISTI